MSLFKDTTETALHATTFDDSKNASVYSPEIVLIISISAGLCSLVTVVGNIIVILSFVINKSLRNFSNYMILSLALSDLTIGAFSMNVFTTYNVHKAWILGPDMCKAWLSVDYTASNASVMNLLVICVDRYLAITKPVKYRRLCTPKSAAIAITVVWSLSFVMWVPPITLWHFTSKNATIPHGQCYIPFINESPTLSVATIMGAFYLPAFVMCALYQRVIHKIKRRQRGIHSIIKDANENLPGRRNWKISICKKRVRRSTTNDVDARKSCSDANLVTDNLPTDLSADGKLPSAYTAIKKQDTVLEISTNSPGTTASVRSRLTCAELLKGSSSDVCLQVENRNNGQAVSADFLKRTLSLRVPNRESQSATTNKQTRKSRSISYTATNEEKSFIVNQIRSARETQRSIRERRVTVLLKFILLCFILLWLPYSIIVVVQAISSYTIPLIVWNLSYWLCYLNSTVNPFCYGFCNENFRRTFKAIFTTKWWTSESRKTLRLGRKVSAQKNNLLKRRLIGRTI